MPQTVQVGTILVKGSPLMPELFGLDIEHYSGNWNVVKTLDAFALDRKIRGAGWSFFFRVFRHFSGWRPFLPFAIISERSSR
jgi:hypothetical protein